MKTISKIAHIETFAYLGFFYLLAHGGIFFISDAIYWDDWALWNHQSNSIMELSNMIGSMFNLLGYLHISMLSIGPWLYKILIFVLMFFSGIFLWFILRRQCWISKEARFLIVLLFLILPLNSARITMATFLYTLCYFSFFAGWYFLEKNRLLAICFFFFSFNTNSMLVFYILPISEWFLRNGNILNIKKDWQLGLQKLDFILLPFVFFSIKNIFFRPYGLYEGYNTHFNIKNLVASPLYMGIDLTQLDVSVLLLIIIMFCGFLIFRKHKQMLLSYTTDNRILYSGIIAFFCGIFPYCLIGKTPTFYEWTSRHQLLMPLGSALILTWAFNYFPETVRRQLIMFVIGLSLAFNIQVYSHLFMDWQKQKSIISLLGDSDEIKNANLVIFMDDSENALKRTYRFYEWNALMKMAYSDEKRFGLNMSEVNKYITGEFDIYFIERYNAGTHIRSELENKIIVQVAPLAKDFFRKCKKMFEKKPMYELRIISSSSRVVTSHSLLKSLSTVKGTTKLTQGKYEQY